MYICSPTNTMTTCRPASVLVLIYALHKQLQGTVMYSIAKLFTAVPTAYCCKHQNPLVHCSTLLYTAVLYVVHYSAVCCIQQYKKGKAVQYKRILTMQEQYIAVYGSTVHSSVRQYSTQQFTAVQYSLVYCTTGSCCLQLWSPGLNISPAEVHRQIRHP